MKKNLHKIFPSKLLLFGEHLINKGGKGLAIPTDLYSGFFNFPKGEKNEFQQQSNEAIEKLAHYILHHETLADKFDLNNFLKEIEKGLYFESNIPQGYGLGSSGALVAAIYQRYRKKIDKKNTAAIKDELAEMESFFHGKSSGLDPIVSYLQQAVILENGVVTTIFDFVPTKNEYKLFLINTHITRQTAPFVNIFLKKYADLSIQKTISNALIPANDSCISSFLNADHDTFTTSIKLLSHLQLELLPELIPASFTTVWKEGLSSNNFHLKICGAGGGGFILGFCKKDFPIKDFLPNYTIVEMLSF